MQNDNTFLSAKNYLVKDRHIQDIVLNTLEEKGLITYHDNRVEFVMKDLDGNVVWIQERYIDPISIYGKQIKSKTKAWTKVWYFFTHIDYTKPIIITEWELDWLSLGNLSNVFWLQGIGNLKKLVEQLKEKWALYIYILTDADSASNKAIWSLLSFDKTFLSWVYDVRGVLKWCKDVNEYLLKYGEISFEDITLHVKCLKEYLDLIDSLLVRGKAWWITINHNAFSQYFLHKYDIASVDGNLFQYQDGVRKLLNQHYVQKMIIDEIDFLISTLISQTKVTDKNNIYDLLLSNGYNEDLKQKLHLQESHCINLKDGIYDPVKKTIIPYQKEYYKIQKFEYPYAIFQTYKEPTKRLSFLGDILDGYSDKESIISFLQEFIGYTCTTSTKFERALLIYGSGANGKGVFLSVVKHIIGESNYSSIGLHEISNPQNLYTLFGKLANIETDMSHGVQLDNFIIKKIVSWEKLLAKPLYKQPLEFVPIAKLLVATNELPFIKSIDNAIRRRFAFLELKKSFYGKEDPGLIDKLIKEKDDIFVRSIQWLERLLNRWFFEIPQELKNLLEVFIKENDPVSSFIEDMNIQKSDTSKVSNANLYARFWIYCKQNGIRKPTKRIFNQSLKNKWFQEFRESNTRWFLMHMS